MSIVAFLDWYGAFIPDYSKERLEIKGFLSMMEAKEHSQHSPQRLAEALHMCKIIRDRNQFIMKHFRI